MSTQPSINPGETAASQRAAAFCERVMPLFDKARDLAESFAKDNEIEKSAGGYLYEFDLKLREAWHRVQDICAKAQQSERAAREAV